MQVDFGRCDVSNVGVVDHIKDCSDLGDKAEHVIETHGNIGARHGE